MRIAGMRNYSHVLAPVRHAASGGNACLALYGKGATQNLVHVHVGLHDFGYNYI
jgi:hypothetical protein